jgi:hypothetical protein
MNAEGHMKKLLLLLIPFIAISLHANKVTIKNATGEMIKIDIDHGGTAPCTRRTFPVYAGTTVEQDIRNCCIKTITATLDSGPNKGYSNTRYEGQSSAGGLVSCDKNIVYQIKLSSRGWVEIVKGSVVQF